MTCRALRMLQWRVCRIAPLLVTLAVAGCTTHKVESNVMLSGTNCLVLRFSDMKRSLDVTDEGDLVYSAELPEQFVVVTTEVTRVDIPADFSPSFNYVESKATLTLVGASRLPHRPGCAIILFRYIHTGSTIQSNVMPFVVGEKRMLAFTHLGEFIQFWPPMTDEEMKRNKFEVIKVPPQIRSTKRR